ncbi:MAG: peptide chain release factor N(5)-glutamine methyltransferase [Clostridia bacterium]|nr:peptide chain release factor N(5)-glutamine methyltransferase [Clostridia bacterium]
MNYFELKKIYEEKFLKSNIEETADIDWIIVEITGKQRSMLPFISDFSEDELEKITQALEKRLKHIPFGYIFGKTEFYGREFFVSNDTLIPRIDTEILTLTATNFINEKIKDNQSFSLNNKVSVLDIGTGTGIIAITLNLETKADVTAVDISEKALEIAMKNSKNLNSNVKFFRSNLFENIGDEKFDFIVSNPPYIKSNVCLELEPEVRLNEPILALDGGEDGLFFYKSIIEKAKNYLKNDGMLIFEIGYDQGEEVSNLMKKDFENITVVKDYSNNDRVVYGKLRSNI